MKTIYAITCSDYSSIGSAFFYISLSSAQQKLKEMYDLIEKKNIYKRLNFESNRFSFTVGNSGYNVLYSIIEIPLLD